MPLILSLIIFIISCLALAFFTSRLIKNLVSIARYLRWKEFVIAFFALGVGTSLPNLFVDLNAAFRGAPEVAFGDIMGGNLIDLTLAMAVALFFARKFISTQSKMIRSSAIFTVFVAILPWILVVRSAGLTRIDGIVLIGAYFLYAWWLFAKDDRFKNLRYGNGAKEIHQKPYLLWVVFKVVVMLGLLFLSSQIIVSTALGFADKLQVSFALIGLLLVALGNCFPEIYFAIISMRKGKSELVLGDLMGSVITCSTLVLGIVALLFPFSINDFTPFFLARIFMVIACIVYLVFINTGRKITKREGLFLLLIYIAFLISEVFV